MADVACNNATCRCPAAISPFLIATQSRTNSIGGLFLTSFFSFDILVVLGATATGKTRLAVELARTLDGEIVSADSRQVYRGMDIGSGKDLNEYGDVPYHLIDIAGPAEEYHLYSYQKDCFKAMTDITSRRKLPVLAGGTGLYLESILDGYEMVEAPENRPLRLQLDGLSDHQLRERLLQLDHRQHNTTDLIERDRLYRAIEISEARLYPASQPRSHPQLTSLIIGIHWERHELHKRIDARLKERLQSGMIEEVEKLHQMGIAYEALELRGLEYRYIAQYLQGKLNNNDMSQKLASAIKKFAKRQHTWFRRMERNGHKIQWVPGDQNPVAASIQIINEMISST